VEKAGAVLGRMLGQPTAVRRAVERSSIWGAWPEIAGSINHTHCFPKRISRGTLYVVVEDSVWMHRVSFAEERILNAVNERLNGEEVRRIEFCLA